MTENNTMTADVLREVASAAEKKWLKLYMETMEAQANYYERDRVYAMMLSAREAYRAANRDGDVIGDMLVTVVNLKADWMAHPTPEKEGRFEGLNSIVDAVEARLNGG